MADTQENSDELPELEGVSMEPAGDPMPAPVAAAPESNTFSAKDLTDDILGGVDFDLPAPPPSVVAAKPMAAPKAPASGGFKPPASLFGQSGGFGASGLKPAPPPVAVAPKPVEAAVFDARELSGPTPDSKELLRAALTSDAAPTVLPPDTARALFLLARVLIQKGIVTVDDLLPPT